MHDFGLAKTTHVLFLVLVTGGLSVKLAGAQALDSGDAKPLATVVEGHRALSYSACTSRAPSSITLTTLGNEEAFRFPILHLHRILKGTVSCKGYLYVTPTRIVYDASATGELENRERDRFDLAKSEVTLKVWHHAFDDALEADTVQRSYRFWLGLDTIDRDGHPAKCNRHLVWRWVQLAFDNFQKARSEFSSLIESANGAVAEVNDRVMGSRSAVNGFSAASGEWRKTLEAFKVTAEAWRTAGSRVELPEEADRHRILAEAAIKEKDIESALKHYRLALDIYPTWPQGQFDLALLCGETKDFQCALVHMKEYLLLVPDAPDARAAYEKTVIWEDKLENPK